MPKKKRDPLIDAALRRFKPTIAAKPKPKPKAKAKAKAQGKRKPAAPRLELARVRRGVKPTAETRAIVEQFIAAVLAKETTAREIYRNFDQSLTALIAALGERAMFRIGRGPVFQIQRSRGGFVVNKPFTYARTGGSSYARLSEPDAEKAGFRCPDNELPGLTPPRGR